MTFRAPFSPVEEEEERGHVWEKESFTFFLVVVVVVRRACSSRPQERERDGHASSVTSDWVASSLSLGFYKKKNVRRPLYRTPICRPTNGCYTVREFVSIVGRVLSLSLCPQKKQKTGDESNKTPVQETFNHEIEVKWGTYTHARRRRRRLLVVWIDRDSLCRDLPSYITTARLVIVRQRQ